MADPISILLENNETRFVGVFGVTDYESKLIIKNKTWRKKMQKNDFIQKKSNLIKPKLNDLNRSETFTF